MESFDEYKKSKDEQELINELILETQYKEEVWKYHPDNKSAVDVKRRYNESRIKIAEVEQRLKEYN